MLHVKFDQMMTEGAGELADLAARRTRLEDGQRKLLQAHYAGAVPLELLKREQDRIAGSLETIEYRLAAHHGNYTDARANLDDSLRLLAMSVTSTPMPMMRTVGCVIRRCSRRSTSTRTTTSGSGIGVPMTGLPTLICRPTR